MIGFVQAGVQEADEVLYCSGECIAIHMPQRTSKILLTISHNS